MAGKAGENKGRLSSGWTPYFMLASMTMRVLQVT